MQPPIRLEGVRQNNLKNLTLEIPPRQLTVITGLSGSGKSSLAFETLYAEGQRRYIDSLSTYTRQFLDKMQRPEVESVSNIPPSIALEQRNSVMNSRSTVGTQTEIVDYLRLLFAKVGVQSCVACGSPVDTISADTLVASAGTFFAGKKGLLLAPFRPHVSEPAKKTSKSKSKKSKPLSLSSIEALISLLKEGGFTRVLADQELVTLDEPESAKRLAHAAQLWIVIDRLRFTTLNTESRARLRDSLDQALRVGKGEVAFADMEALDRPPRLYRAGRGCTECGVAAPTPSPELFSFNSPIGACTHCSGFGYTLELDERLVVPDPSCTIKNGAIDPLSKPSFEDWQTDMFQFAERNGISIGKRYRDLTAAQRKLLWDGDPEDDLFPGIRGCFTEMAKWKYKLHIRVFIRRYQEQKLCTECHGARLKPESLAVRVGALNLPEALNLPIDRSVRWATELSLTAAQKKIAAELLQQVLRRLTLLNTVGVGYLTLSRLAKTLSGGEFQRISLATQLGNGLCGTLYVLDEPSIGLHAADTDRLIGVLKQLRDQGNTVVVVEHDLEVIRSADHLIELGPFSGARGGELVAEGTPSELQKESRSLTGKYLSGALSVSDLKRPTRGPSRRDLRITGCEEHNLKNIDITIPLERFTVLSGVSGSGKTTLLHRTLFPALQKHFRQTHDAPGRYAQLYGAEHLGGVVLLDQSPIGRSSRSNPATYMKAWDEVRKLYANQVIALRRGYTPQHFSFNVDGGRCPTCKGEGEIAIDMHFLAEVRVPCEECQGRRFKRAVLDVSYRGKNISELLHTTIDEAYDLFRDQPQLARKLGLLRDVGLGYLQVGQSSTTLSGGESQRLKIAHVLDDREARHMLYLFDEPTTGLHCDDIKRLLHVLQDLVQDQHTVLVIEHQLDLIAQADWVIELGPTGGETGGYVTATGTPQDLAENPKSITGVMFQKQGFRFPPRERPEVREV